MDPLVIDRQVDRLPVGQGGDWTPCAGSTTSCWRARTTPGTTPRPPSPSRRIMPARYPEIAACEIGQLTTVPGRMAQGVGTRVRRVVPGQRKSGAGSEGILLAVAPRTRPENRRVSGTQQGVGS